MLSKYRLFILAVVIVVMTGIWLLMHKTAFGRVVRAGVQKPDMVAALGIRLQPYMTAIVVLGVATAALGGVLFGPIAIVHPAMGMEIMTVASWWWSSAPGQLLGVVAAALLVGVVRGITTHFMPAASEASMYVLMFLVLMFRPRGLLVSASSASNENPHHACIPEKQTPRPVDRRARPGAAAHRVPGHRPHAGLGHRGHHPGRGRHGPEPAGGLHGLGLLRPRGLVRHRRLRRRPGADPLVQEQMLLPVLFSIVFTATLALIVGFLILRPARRLLLAAHAGPVRADLRDLVPLDQPDRRRRRPGRHRARHLRPDRPQQPPELLRVRGAHRLCRAGAAAPHRALALRPRAGGDPREPAARHLPGLRRRALQAAGLRALGTVTGLAGSLMVFLHRLAAAESTAVHFSGELLAMVVIGGMHSFLGPALGAVFFLLFRELFSMWTDNWLLCFGLIFSASLCSRPRVSPASGARSSAACARRPKTARP